MGRPSIWSLFGAALIAAQFWQGNTNRQSSDSEFDRVIAPEVPPSGDSELELARDTVANPHGTYTAVHNARNRHRHESAADKAAVREHIQNLAKFMQKEAKKRLEPLAGELRRALALVPTPEPPTTEANCVFRGEKVPRRDYMSPSTDQPSDANDITFDAKAKKLQFMLPKGAQTALKDTNAALLGSFDRLECCGGRGKFVITDNGKALVLECLGAKEGAACRPRSTMGSMIPIASHKPCEDKLDCKNSICTSTA
eukprot:CAMPEP_0172674460 /NCGR_PEP_ID=MMETSP1074-20121228/12749_1 /TAXON_ID=2916 /ORGANISM="Ceratium fusus, Strain PA161109" /LENGTH=254 /DNA_ID=CAMNT_0013491869 /DNA_START=52 /DNA_END=813 /DNA_ORIENTATION=+